MEKKRIEPNDQRETILPPTEAVICSSPLRPQVFSLIHHFDKLEKYSTYGV